MSEYQNFDGVAKARGLLPGKTSWARQLTQSVWCGHTGRTRRHTRQDATSKRRTRKNFHPPTFPHQNLRKIKRLWWKGDGAGAWG